MIYPSEEQTIAMKKCALFLEKHNYSKVKSFLKSLSKKDYTFFWQFFLDDDLLYEIARDKDRVASLLAKSCNVTALPEDRKRIVFTIAKFGNMDLPDINNALIKEFGPHFKLFDKYTLTTGARSWQEVVKKTREIRNGYINLANLAVESQVTTMIHYYEMSKETDINKINHLHELASKVLAKFANQTDLPPTAPALVDYVPLIIEFYKATNRLQLDIDRLWEAPNLEDVVINITVLNATYETKLKMAKKQIPLTDLDAAENEIRKILRELYFDSTLVSTEELLREHVPMEPIKPTKIA